MDRVFQHGTPVLYLLSFTNYLCRPVIVVDVLRPYVIFIFVNKNIVLF